jgi:hypothetical protein
VEIAMRILFKMINFVEIGTREWGGRSKVNVMHSYFCPCCGKALRLGDCKLEKRLGAIRRILCVRCGVSVQRSGGELILSGVVIALIFAFIMPIEEAGLAVGGGFCFVGLIRLARQFRATVRFRKEEAAVSERYSP